ncbi:conserved exported protein of unknown function [Tenacibaculum sp. 190130A14a]|uniref:3-keto-disaccharide hydrolase domain-containing protein n=1 Tax=Tenacibaculum polynesiense TaxID=3137857 RepID=A0ABP1F0V0_9FLAO
MNAKFFIALLLITNISLAQKIIPLDTTNWKINAKSYIFENYKGKDAIYIQGGAITLKDKTFLNGTIEFDVFLKEEQAFPGVYFRGTKNLDSEQWFMRPHLSGKPDANQAAPATKGITPWQLYFGEKYSFPYKYKFNDWTHVKLVVNNNKAQVFLDEAQTPNLSWNLFHKTQEGLIAFRGGRFSGLHLANIKIDPNQTVIKNFIPKTRTPIKNLVPKWIISDKFEEKHLENIDSLKILIRSRKWNNEIIVEEGTAANISRKLQRYDGQVGNTVFAKIEVQSDKPKTKLFEFGYSDRVVVILNGKPIYKGTNKWRSRDYRYLGTVGLFDAVYLPLKKGKNTLLIAVSEDFGGWLITGRFKDSN